MLLRLQNLKFSTVEYIYMASIKTRLQILETKYISGLQSYGLLHMGRQTQEYELLLVHLPPASQ